jgi:hypothetical protein
LRADTAVSNAQSQNDEEEGGEGDGASYQLDMMRCLREVNVDNNTVGWCAPSLQHAAPLMLAAVMLPSCSVRLT